MDIDFSLRRDKPIDYVKDCKWWVIGEDKVRMRCATLPHIDAKVLTVTTDDRVIPLDGKLIIVCSHYSDDDTHLKEIDVYDCEQILHSLRSVSYTECTDDGIVQGVLPDQHITSFKFSDHCVKELK